MWVGVSICPATPKAIATPAKSRLPVPMAATIGITMATWPCDMPVSTPMMKDTQAMTTGTGSGDA